MSLVFPKLTSLPEASTWTFVNLRRSSALPQKKRERERKKNIKVHCPLCIKNQANKPSYKARVLAGRVAALSCK